jgi:hypothetical protein
MDLALEPLTKQYFTRHRGAEGWRVHRRPRSFLHTACYPGCR